ncbi:MAG: hypothetical protein ACRCYT_05195 [Cetobacterium sp.]
MYQEMLEEVLEQFDDVEKVVIEVNGSIAEYQQTVYMTESEFFKAFGEEIVTWNEVDIEIEKIWIRHHRVGKTIIVKGVVL